jgi:PIN domain nuclease of toxin-antitoxin system
MNLLPSDGEKPNANSIVLDASALLTLLLEEPGTDTVGEAIKAGALIGAVNLAEAVAKLLDYGWTEAEVLSELRQASLSVAEFTADHAWRAGVLRNLTRRLGLSLGDRACLALAQASGLPVLTADRGWSQLDVGVTVRLCR